METRQCISLFYYLAALHLVRCEVEKAESLPHLASHRQLGPLTQLLEIFLRNLRNNRITSPGTQKNEHGVGDIDSEDSLLLVGAIEPQHLPN